MSEKYPVTNSKILKTRGGISLGPYMMQSPPKCIPYPPVYGYMYTSGPKPVGLSERHRKANSRPIRKSERGLLAGDYFNMMFDPRVYRGSTFQSFQDTERERCIKAKKQVERREIIKKRRTLTTGQYKLGGILRPKTPPPKARDVNREATQMFLMERLEKADEITVQVQTEVEQGTALRPDYLKIKSGITVGTQIADWDLFDFEEEIAVIAPVLTERIIEQSVTEAMEEDEQLFVRGVWATAHQKLHTAQSHMEVLMNQEKEFAAKAETRRLQLYQEELDNKDLEENIGITCFAQSYIALLDNHLVSSLHKDGYLSDLSYEAIKADFQPWLSQEVKKEVARSKIAAAILEDIIITNVKYRSAAVLGDLGLEIDFRGLSEESLTRVVVQKRNIVLSDSNGSTPGYHEMEMDGDGGGPPPPTTIGGTEVDIK